MGWTSLRLRLIQLDFVPASVTAIIQQAEGDLLGRRREWSRQSLRGMFLVAFRSSTLK